jgi:ubiquinone/menaquinone biosynthesis C-methylase UbiE
MDPALQRRVQRYGWDKAADFYELYWQRQLEPAQTKLLEMAALQQGETILDIACGTGLLTFQMAERVGPQGALFATDISDQMVARATMGAEQRQLKNMKFSRMDAEEMIVEAAAYDVALCSLGLMYVTDAGRVVNGMVRALKHGGRAAAAVWGQRSRCGWAEIFPIVQHRVKSEVCPLFFQLGSGDLLANTFRAAGLVDVKMERVSALLEYASADEACGAAFAGGPVALAYSRFDDQTKKEVHAEYLASIEPFKKGNGYVVPGEFVVAVGYKE